MHKFEQLRWMYGVFTGVSVAFFFSLIGTTISFSDKPLLLLSAVIFAIILPVFTCFTLINLYIIEEGIPQDKALKVLESKRAELISRYAIYGLVTALIFLVFHLSLIAGLVMVTSTLAIFVEFSSLISGFKDEA
jgi:hypothetical protein